MEIGILFVTSDNVFGVKFALNTHRRCRDKKNSALPSLLDHVGGLGKLRGARFATHENEDGLQIPSNLNTVELS